MCVSGASSLTKTETFAFNLKSILPLNFLHSTGNEEGGSFQETEEEKPSTEIPEVHLESSRPLHSSASAEPTIEYQAPSSVDALLQEASEYLNGKIIFIGDNAPVTGQTSNGRDNSPRRFVEAQLLEEESESRVSLSIDIYIDNFLTRLD